MPEGTVEQQVKGEIRSGKEQRRDLIDKRIQGHMDWQRSLHGKVNSGIITQEEMDRQIARALVAREMVGERSSEWAKRDALTGIYNKGVFSSRYEELVQSGDPFGLLVLDLDYFKDVNDKYGHKAGDSVLIQTVLNLSNRLRQIQKTEAEEDTLARYGGEELAVLLPGVSKPEDLSKIAEELRVSVGNSPYSVTASGKEETLPVTVSIGGGIYTGGDKNVFFERVDKEALYGAKQAGRNKVIILPQ